MLDIPVNHKTIILFDHINFLSSSCGLSIEFDALVNKQTKQSAATQAPVNPIMKSCWVSCVESALEFSRIVFDLFPENEKLIRLMVTKYDQTLNSWSDAEQNLEHLMNVLGAVAPPTPQLKQAFEGEDFINLCKGLNISASSLAQTTDLQSLCLIKNNKNSSLIRNTGRIILFTSVNSVQTMETIEQFLVKSIEELNKNIHQINLEKQDGLVDFLNLHLIELIIIDVVPSDQEPRFNQKDSVLKQVSPSLRTRIISCKAGPQLPQKLIQLTQSFYDLSITSITNIPMKEELNANSSANYDVEILHSKLLHDQLKLAGLYKSCLVPKDGVDTVCLKWSNPKTNINEFNLSSSAFRITPIDVNSRPATCLGSFLLGGRCVILEIPRLLSANSNMRVSSHFLCNHGNELFMHTLNYPNKLNLNDSDGVKLNTIEDFNAENLKEYRLQEFCELLKANTLPKLALNNSFLNDRNGLNVDKVIRRNERATKKWPVAYTDDLISNLIQLKPILLAISDEFMTDNDYTECSKCIECIKSCESKNESIFNHFIVPQPQVQSLKLEELYRRLWTELEIYLKTYQELSNKHKWLYQHVKALNSNRAIKIDTTPASAIAKILIGNANNNKNAVANRRIFEAENEKLNKKKKIAIAAEEVANDVNLFDFWSKHLNEKSRAKLDFFGRTSNPVGAIAPLYAHLKLDDINSKTSIGKSVEMV